MILFMKPILRIWISFWWGPSAPNPSGLLSENVFQVFLKKVREYYSYILIDTPPIGTVVDAAVIGRYCDGAVFPDRAGKCQI